MRKPIAQQAIQIRAGRGKLFRGAMPEILDDTNYQDSLKTIIDL